MAEPCLPFGERDRRSFNFWANLEVEDDFFFVAASGSSTLEVDSTAGRPLLIANAFCTSSSAFLDERTPLDSSAFRVRSVNALYDSISTTKLPCDVRCSVSFLNLSIIS